jgi:t-SNARE complex subunit (syntaxin)
MADRLSDLKGSINASKDDMVAIDIDMANAEKGVGAGNEFMSDFFEEVGHIKSLMSQIRTNIKTIQDTYAKQNWVDVGAPGQTQGEQLEELLRSTNLAATKIRNKLREMKMENDKCPPDSSQKRIRTNMQSTLSKKFLDLMQEYQAIQTGYKDKYRERVQRAAEIVKPGITQDEVEQIIHSENANALFSDQILNDPRHAGAKNALVGIQQQNRDIKQLEKSINELQQMFIDMATVVDVQGQALDQIGLNVNDAVMSSGVSVSALEVAERYNKQRKRRMAIFMVIGLLIFILIGLGLAAALTNGGA